VGPCQDKQENSDGLGKYLSSPRLQVADGSQKDKIVRKERRRPLYKPASQYTADRWEQESVTDKGEIL